MLPAINWSSRLLALLGLLCSLAAASHIQADRGGSYYTSYSCQTGGCVTQDGCVPRYSSYRTAFSCPQSCVIDRCRRVVPAVPPERRVCYQLTAIATGQRLASRETYDRRSGRTRYATVVASPGGGASEQPGARESDRWNLVVGPGSNYYIQNSDTGEYLRAGENNFVQLVPGRPTDDSFLFKPHLVRGSWSCVQLQSICYGGYLYGERFSSTSNFVLMTQDLQRCYQESLWSVTSVYC